MLRYISRRSRHLAGPVCRHLTPYTSSDGHADYLGLQEDADVVAGALTMPTPTRPPPDLPDLQPLRRPAPTNRERLVPTTFGFVRLDKDNRIHRHGQFEMEDGEAEEVFAPEVMALKSSATRQNTAERAAKRASRMTRNTPEEKEELPLVGAENVHHESEGPIDSQYFRFSEDALNAQQNSEYTSVDPEVIPTDLTLLNEVPQHSIEDEYFGTAFSTSTASVDSETRAEQMYTSASAHPLASSVLRDGFRESSPESTTTRAEHGASSSSLRESPQHVFEEQYFANAFEETSEETARKEPRSRLELLDSKYAASRKTSIGSDTEQDDVHERSIKKEPFRQTRSSKKLNQVTQSHQEEESTADASRPLKEDQQQRVEDGQKTGLDVARQIRRAAVDTRTGPNRGKQLRAEVLDLSQEPSSAVLELLRRSVLYDGDELLVLFKPYGLPIHSTSGRMPHSLSALLPRLERQLRCRRLHTVHRLDRDTTGCLLLAKTSQMARRLQQMFHDRRVLKTYWAVVRGVLDPESGAVDMPLVPGSVPADGGAGYERMVPAPVLAGRRTPRDAVEAVTRYRTLAHTDGCSLVELSPSTGVRHQLRVHLGLGLDRPVLGDHKYSRWDTVRPQKLPASVLRALRLRQPEVRHLPLHLHARAISVPELQLRVTAPVPLFFKKNLRRLKLTKSENSAK